MASFYIPLSGLDSDTTALNTIANNLSNMNTTGYKSQTVNFADLFYTQIGEEGSGNLLQQGAGVQTADIQAQFTQGSISSTGNSTDVAINGNGFFVLQNGAQNVYTRDGNFALGSNGNLTSQDGLDVMGYPAVNGVVNTNAPLAPIAIPVGQVQSPQATSSFGMTANLNSAAAVGATVPGQITVYDSLGTSHIATVTYTKTATNTWSYSIALPAGDQTAVGTATNATGTLTFNSNGSLTSPATNVTGIAFTGLADGANGLNFTWNLLGSSGAPTITQVNASSAVTATTQNGFASGQYQSFTVGNDGTVTASYSNGQTMAIGKLALGEVANTQGLKQLGAGEYATTLASGNAAIGASGTAGVGTLQDGSLEQSNVNISQQFSELIIAQRAFEANSKAVTTFDSVVQETINMVH